MLTIEQSKRGQAVQELIQALKASSETGDGRGIALFLSPSILIFSGGNKQIVPIFPNEPSSTALDNEISAYNAQVTAYYAALVPFFQGFDTIDSSTTFLYDIGGNVLATFSADGTPVKMQISVTGLRPQVVYLDRA